MAPPGTLDQVVHLDDPPGPGVLRRRRFGYAITTVLLSALVVAAVVDGASPAGVYGVQSRTVRDTGADGLELAVRYATVSRPGLASPFDIEVRRPGGFDAPVTLAVRSRFLSLWDQNGLEPQPRDEARDDERTFWTFDPPDGEVLTVSFDGRIEPGAQNGQRGRVAVLDEDGTELAAVSFRTRVWP